MKTKSILRLLVVCAALLLSSVPAHAGTEAILAKGFEPNTAYHMGEFDSVNTLNGELSVTIPLGPVYTTNGTLKYQFSLRHYDNAWAFFDYFGIDSAPTQFSQQYNYCCSSVWTTRQNDQGFFVTTQTSFAYYERVTFDLDSPSSAGLAGSEAVPTGNAGMGWYFTMGEFSAAPAHDPHLQGTYTDPQGTSYAFHPSIHKADAPGSASVAYTQDNSYLRLRTIDGNTMIREIDFPDGTVKRFECVERCNQWNAEWHLQWTADPFGNVLLVERQPALRPTNGQDWVWTFIEGTLPDGEDGAGPRYYRKTDRGALKEVRRHKVTIKNSNRFPDHPLLTERVDSLDLAGPNGDESLHYQFQYAQKKIARTNVRPWIKEEDLFYPYTHDNRIMVDMLDRIELPPGAGDWKFTYHEGSPSDGPNIGYEYCMDASQPTGCPDRPDMRYPTSAKAGRLDKVHTPLGGGYRYDYGVRVFPKHACRPSKGKGESYGGGAMVGIKSKTEINAAGADVQRPTEEQAGQPGPPAAVRWLYAGSGYAKAFIDNDNNGYDDGDNNHDGDTTDAGDTPQCRWPDEYVAAMLDPNGLLTLHYYNARLGDPGYGAPYSADPKQSNTVTRPDAPPATRFLTSEIWQVADKTATSEWATDLRDAVRRLFRQYRDSADTDSSAGATKLRSSYGTYEWSDQRCLDEGNGPPDCRPLNMRLTSQHARFHDDGLGGGQCDVTGKPVTESFIETVNKDFDGLGHFRQVHTFGNTRAVGLTSPGLEHWDHRVTYTKYNSGVSYTAGQGMPTGIPAVTSPWLLGLSTRASVLERLPNAAMTSIHTTLYDFDPGRGYLRGVRKLTKDRVAGALPLDAVDVKALAVPTSANDFLTVISRKGVAATHGTRSVVDTVVRETYYGGDGGGLPAGSVEDGQFSTGPGIDDYRIENTYRQGTLIATDYLCNETTVFARTFAAELAPNMRFGLPSTMADSSGLKTTYLYDNLGRIDKIIPPGKATATPPGAVPIAFQDFTYAVQSANGSNGLTITRDGGRTLSYVYDGMGRLLQQTATGAAGTSSHGYGYSVSGRIQTETLAGGGTVLHTFDPLGREIRTKDAAGKVTEHAYCGVRTLVTKFNGIAGLPGEAQFSKRFDAFGRVTEANDNVARAEYEYDAGAQITKVSVHPVGDRVPAKTQVREFGYDGRGVLATVRHPEMVQGGTAVQVRTTVDARGHATATDYDWVGTATPPASALYKWRLRFDYDAAERLVNVTQPQGAGQRPLKSFKFHGNGDDFGKRNQLESSTRYNYFPDPARTQGTASIFVTTARSYDACLSSDGCTGLLKSETTTATGVSEGTGATKTILTATAGYAYDALSRLVRVDYPQRVSGDPARSIWLGYNQDDLTSVSHNGPLSLTNGLATMTYHLNGMVHEVRYANANAKDVYTKDGSGLARPGKITWNWTGGQASSGDYLYDGAGNISHIGADSFLYDAALRLRSATVSGKSQTYEYDALGNMIRMNGPSANRAFAVDLKTSRMTDPGVTYDESGNVTALAGLAMSYDMFSAMTQSEGPTTGRAFVYDAAGERIGVLEYKPARREVWSLRDSANRVLRDYERTFDTAGAPVWKWKKDYVYRGSMLSNTIGPDGIRDVHVDHLGSTRFVTDAAGKLVGAGASSTGDKFLPFGSPVFPRALAERMAFTGHERDDDGTNGGAFDLDYMHARYYSPHYGRFLSLDPVLGNVGEPQSWNRYAYARNNPLRFVDPDGAQAEDPMVKEQSFLHQADIWAGRFNRFVAESEKKLDHILNGECGKTLTCGTIQIGGLANIRTATKGVYMTAQAGASVATRMKRQILSITFDGFSADSKRSLVKWLYQLYGKAIRDGVDDISISFYKSGKGAGFTEAEQAAMKEFAELGNYTRVESLYPNMETYVLQITPKKPASSSPFWETFKSMLSRMNVIDPHG